MALAAARDTPPEEPLGIALDAFASARGMDRGALAAWLDLAPDRLAALARQGRPRRGRADYALRVQRLARRFGADPWQIDLVLRHAP